MSRHSGDDLSFLVDDLDLLQRYLSNRNATTKTNIENLRVSLNNVGHDENVYIDLKLNDVPLMCMLAFMNCVDCFSYLNRKYGCNILQVTNDSFSTIHYAIQGRAELVLAYIFRYAPKEKIVNIVQTDTQRTCTLVYLAISGDCPYALERLLEFNLIGTAEHYKYSKEITWATKRSNSADCLYFIFKHLVSKNSNDSSPLRNAIISQYPDVVKILLKADPASIKAVSDNKTILDLACTSYGSKIEDSITIINYVLDYYNVSNDPNAIFAALDSKFFEIVNRVLKSGCSVTHLKDGRNPAGRLHKFKQEDAIIILTEMLNRGLDINLAGKGMNTAFGEVFKSFERPIGLLDFMIAHGADMNMMYYKAANMSAERIKTVVKANKSPAVQELVRKYSDKFF